MLSEKSIWLKWLLALPCLTIGTLVLACSGTEMREHSGTEKARGISVDRTFLELRDFLYPDGLSLKEIATGGFSENEVVGEAESLVKSGQLDKARELLLHGNGPGLQEDPNYWFLMAYVQEQLGDSKAAKASIHEVLALPVETRMILGSWHILRRLGEEPPKEVADQVLGVVFEIAVDDMITIAAGYADGTPRLLMSSGGGVLGEAEDFTEAERAAASLLVETAKPSLASFSREKDRRLPEPLSLRVALLTPAGVYSKSARATDDDTDLHPIIEAAQGLMWALAPRYKAGQNQK